MISAFPALMPDRTAATNQERLDHRTRHRLCAGRPDCPVQRCFRYACDDVLGRHHEADFRPRRSDQCLPGQVVGRVPTLGSARAVVHRRPFRHALKSAACCRGAALILGVALVVSGVMRIILAFGIRKGTPWMWVVLSGVVTLLLGLVILAHWPISSLFFLGALLGVDLIIIGIGWLFVGFGSRRLAQRGEGMLLGSGGV